MLGSGHADVASSPGIPEAGSVSLAGVDLHDRAMDLGMFQDGDRLSLRWSNERPGVDAGTAGQFKAGRHWPGTTEADCWAAWSVEWYGNHDIVRLLDKP